MADFEVKTCPACNRDFAVLFSRRNGYKCLDHCGNPCCRKAHCSNVKPTQAVDRDRVRRDKRCMVCGAPGEMFERFAPCDRTKCRGYKQNFTYAGFQWGCWSQMDPEHSERWHHPSEKPRFHIGYCSLACYNSPEYGHRQKLQRRWRKNWTRYGQFARNRRKELKEQGPEAEFF